jgi:VanZ family protein
MISYLLSIRQSVRLFFIVIYVGCIIALSLLPMQDLPQVPMFPEEDKLIHFLMYFGFSVLFCWTLKTELNFSRIFLVILVTVSWGILMEYLQLDMHLGRSFSWYDELANSIGVCFGILTYTLVTRNKEANLTSKSV